MQPSPTDSRPPITKGRVGWLGLLLILLGWLAYANSFHCPFVFDDKPGIVENPSIRSLWPLTSALSTTGSSPTNSRPITNLSLAINYKLGGLNPFGYHLANWLFHTVGALALFGIVRRTLRRGWPTSRHWPKQDQSPISPAASREAEARLAAFFVAAIWAVHPLLTESVTCVIQRTESLMGMFFLLSLYAFVRSLDAAHPGRWWFACVAACLLGSACKEVMVVAPVVILLYDCVFVSGRFADPLKIRWRLYLPLFSTWVFLGALVLSGGGSRNGAAGYSHDITLWQNLLTQSEAIVIYLKLAFWPNPLVVDYGSVSLTHLASLWWKVAIVIILLSGAAAATMRKSAIGFLGAAFFLILAPSSSVIPLLTQTIAEHRMYLPLATVATPLVVWLWSTTGKYRILLLSTILVVLGCATWQRNATFATEESVWIDTTKKCPDNPRAWYNLGSTYLELGKLEDSEKSYAKTLQVEGTPLPATDPFLDRPEAQPEIPSRPFFDRALYIEPFSAKALVGLGRIADRRGDFLNALARYDQALTLKPRDFDALLNRASTLHRMGRFAEAAGDFASATSSQPNNADAWLGLGQTLMAQGTKMSALDAYKQALALRPDYPEAHVDFGYALFVLGQADEAKAHYEKAIALDPKHAGARKNLGFLFACQGKLAEAKIQFSKSLEIDPEDTTTRFNYGLVCERLGDGREALKQFEQARGQLHNQPGLQRLLDEHIEKLTHPSPQQGF